MNGEAIFSLAVASTPVVGVAVGLAVVYVPRWRRARRLRILDEMFKADEEWWEEQFRGVGDERPPE